MSKKYNRKKQKKSFPWLLLALGGILIVAAIVLFGAQGASDGGTASIAVDQQSIDYGEVKFNTPKTFAIKVTNTGEGTLRFKEEPYIEVAEGC
jgi:hypothetical protein